jgi:hypothetical protein
MNIIGTRDKFPVDIKEIRSRDIAMPRKITINLAIAVIDQPYNIAGNLFYVWEAPDVVSYISVRINSTQQPAVEFRQMTGLITPFDKLYITTPAGQAGNLVLLIATEAPGLLSLIDNRSASITGLAGILAELQGVTAAGTFIGVTVGVAAVAVLAANATRKACLIQALSTNTVSVFLGFANTVTAGGAPGIWFAALQPGMAFCVDDYRGPIFGIATAAGQVVGTGEW